MEWYEQLQWNIKETAKEEIMTAGMNVCEKSYALNLSFLSLNTSLETSVSAEANFKLHT